MTSATTTCRIPRRARSEEPCERPVFAPLVVCDHHYGRLTRTLTDIESYAATLPYVTEHGTTPVDDTKSTPSRVEPPAPYRLDVSALLDPRTRWDHHRPGPRDILGILNEWANLGRSLRYIDPLLRHYAYVSSEIQSLIRNLPAIASLDLVVDLDDELRDILDALKSAHGEHPARPIGLCPKLIETPTDDDEYALTECGTPLYLPPDRVDVHCDSCHAPIGVPHGEGAVTCSKCGHSQTVTAAPSTVRCRNCGATWSGIHLVQLHHATDRQDPA